MKKTVAACILPLLAAAPVASMAAGPGCGLGQQIFAGKSGLASHVLAATTNGSSSNQLFGLTFDSLGCNAEAVITAAFQRDVFVAGNFDNIARDAAQGGGQHLESLAELMQMPESDAALFFALTQSRYQDLFGQPVADHSEWLARLDDVLADEPALSRYALSAQQS